MNQNYHLFQQLKTDFLNISQCWLYSILYYHKIYPMHTFQFKNTYGIPTPVTLSKKVKDYVDRLFKELENNILLINYMEVEIISDGYPVMKYRLSAGFMENDYYNNRHQKQTELKYFINKMLQDFQNKGKDIPGQNKTFNFYIEYRYDKNQKIKTGQFVDKWIISQQKLQDNQQIVGSSLKFADMNVIISRFSNK